VVKIKPVLRAYCRSRLVRNDTPAVTFLILAIVNLLPKTETGFDIVLID